MTWPRYSLRTKLLVIAAALPVVWFVSLFFRVDKQYVDPMTGALKHTTSYWGVQMSEVIEPTVARSTRPRSAAAVAVHRQP